MVANGAFAYDLIVAHNVDEKMSSAQLLPALLHLSVHGLLLRSKKYRLEIVNNMSHLSHVTRAKLM